MTGAAIDAEPAVTTTDGKGYRGTEHVRAITGR